MNKIKAILFDLDGTLLPMDNDYFVQVYLGELGKQGAGWGYDPREMVAAIYKGTGYMVKNDGSRLNEEAFWAGFKKHISNLTSEEIDATIPKFDAFYADPNGFHKAKVTTGENPYASAIVAAARAKAEKVILATNPLFPPSAIASRLQWIGLTPDLFDDITYYDNCSYCKPNPLYFAKILEKHGLRPEECVMIGNNVSEDIVPASSVGIRSILVTDCMINTENLPLDGIEACVAAELAGIIENL